LNFVEIIFFGEIVDIWAKEIKGKRKKNCKSKERAAILSLGQCSRKKKDKKKRRKTIQATHTKKYSSFLFLSN